MKSSVGVLCLVVLVVILVDVAESRRCPEFPMPYNDDYEKPFVKRCKGNGALCSNSDECCGGVGAMCSQGKDKKECISLYQKTG